MAHRICGHGWLTAAVLAAVLPSGALAQSSDVTTPPPAGAAATDDTTGDVSNIQIPLPPLQWGGYADLAEGYSTNAQGGFGGTGTSDTFTRGTIGTYLQYARPRLSANLNYSLTGVYWGKTHDQNHLTNRLNLTSRLIAIPDTLVVTANAYAAPADLTRLGAVSASGEPVSRYNSRDTYGYFVRPQFTLRYKDYLTSDLSLGHGGVFFVTPSAAAIFPPPPITPAQNALSTTLTEQLTSGTYFERLQFSAIGSYGQFSQTVRSQRTEEGLLNVSYALTRYLKVFGIGGYDDYKSSTTLAKNLSGPTGLGGFTLSDGPDFTLTAEAGTQNNLPTYMGSLRWIISPLTQFVASATDSITTPQGDILSRLGGLSGGGLGDPGSLGNVGLGGSSYNGNLPFSPGGLALDNAIYRIRSIEGSLTHTDDRNTYTASVFANERDRLDVTPVSVLPRTSVYGLRGVVTRTLNADFTATASATYSIGDEFGGHDRVFYADAIVTYHLTAIIDLYLTDHYTDRESKNLVGFTNAPVSEDQVILGIRAHF